MERILPTNTVRADGRTRGLGDLVAAMSGRLPASRGPAAPLAIVSAQAADLLAAAAWLAHTGTDGLILPKDRLIAPVRASVLERGYRIVDLADGSVAEPAKAAPVFRGRVCLLTSGTTGAPKLVEHSWKSLFTMAKVRGLPALKWMVTYQGGTYAWFQLVTMALFLPGQSLVIATDRSPAAFIEGSLEQGVTAISATPTLWRMALMQFPRETLRRLPMRQITLGGERVDQAILDQLRELFPSATITHIYASTEAGGCIIVRDGREGFPAAWLAAGGDAAEDGRPRLQVRDGMLWICSPHASAHHRGWFNSGDAVEVRGDRVFILGRADRSVINVGGMKVAACDIERQLLQHPAVLWCRVYGRRAPMVGELVAADVVRRAGVAPANEGDLAQFCGARLADYMVPRLWSFLGSIPATDNLKTELA